MASTRVSRLLDPVLGTAGVFLGLGSLTYPFGRDQGLYYYVAREWVLRGSIPYKDVLDHKTPGIYLINALSVLLFGEQMWGVRLFDLFCVVAVGLVAGSLSANSGERVRPGVRGLAILATSILYYGYLNFWNTAQSELWYSMLAFASAAAVLRVSDLRRASLAAGALAGAAVLMKPPAMWTVLVAVVLLVLRARPHGREEGGGWREHAKAAVRPLAFFATGSGVVLTVVLGYFAVKGAMPALVDIVVGANSYYVKHESGAPAFPGIVNYHWCYAPLVPALLVYLLWALKWSDTKRHVVALALLASTYLAVIMQGKYYLLHWSVCIPAFATIAANAARTIHDAWERRGRVWAFAPTFAGALLGLWLGSLYTWHGPATWWNSTRHAWRWSTGREPREEFSWQFAEPAIEYFFFTSERCGNWLREHTTPDDFVTVRGFQPEIYAVAKRRHSGRFFWTTFIVNPARAYKRAEWLKEDLDDLRAHPPKYVVALTKVAHGPDSVEYFEALGYRTVEVMWELTIMERGAP
jgi:hypothetical protein